MACPSVITPRKTGRLVRRCRGSGKAAIDLSREQFSWIGPEARRQIPDRRNLYRDPFTGVETLAARFVESDGGTEVSARVVLDDLFLQATVLGDFRMANESGSTIILDPDDHRTAAPD